MTPSVAACSWPLRWFRNDFMRHHPDHRAGGKAQAGRIERRESGGECDADDGPSGSARPVSAAASVACHGAYAMVRSATATTRPSGMSWVAIARPAGCRPRDRRRKNQPRSPCPRGSCATRWRIPSAIRGATASSQGRGGRTGHARAGWLCRPAAGTVRRAPGQWRPGRRRPACCEDVAARGDAGQDEREA